MAQRFLNQFAESKMCDLRCTLHFEYVLWPDHNRRFAKPKSKVGIPPFRAENRKRDPIAKVRCLPPAHEVRFLLGQVGKFLDFRPQKWSGHSGGESGYRVDHLQI